MFSIDTILLTDAFIAVSICSSAIIFVIISIAFEQNWWRSRTECKSFNKKKVSNLTGSRQIYNCHSEMGSLCLLTFDNDEWITCIFNLADYGNYTYVPLPSGGGCILCFQSCHILYLSFSFLPYFVIFLPSCCILYFQSCRLWQLYDPLPPGGGW